MKTKHFFLVILIICIFYKFKLFTQETISTIGADITETNGSISYTLGQTFFEANSGAKGSLNQEIQQPYEILTSDVSSYTTITLTAKAYPNPTSNQLILSIDDYKKYELLDVLTDINSRILKNAKISDKNTSIPMELYKQEDYIINVRNKNIQNYKKIVS